MAAVSADRVRRWWRVDTVIMIVALAWTLAAVVTGKATDVICAQVWIVGYFIFTEVRDGK